MLRRLESYKRAGRHELALHVFLFTACALLVTFSGFRFVSLPDLADRASTPRRYQRPLTMVPGNGFRSLLQQDSGLHRALSLFPDATETEPEAGIDDDPEGRGDWFTFQRTYPGNVIPSDARLKAWESQPEFELNGVVPQAALTWRPIGPSPTVSA